MRSNKEVRDLLLSEVQLGSKTSCTDSLTVTASNHTAAIPSPQAAITPLSHDSMVNHHHHNARSASVPTVRMHPSHFQHIDLPARPAISAKIRTHSNEIPAENQSMHLPHANNYHPPMEHFEQQQQQQSYGNHYNSTGVIHSTSLNSQTNAEYNDANYYNSFYGNYDDQILRPYSASSNSCSSSNSEADSQMTASHHHPMLPNNNQDRQAQQQQQQQHCHQQIGHPPNNHVLVTTNTTDLHTPNSGSHLDAANLSPEYIDCMDQRAPHHQSFEVNCFGNIGNVGIHHLSSDDLQSNYMPNNHSGAGVDNSNSILLNGNASSGGSVLFNGNNLSGNQSIADAIQYTSVIVDNSYHMSNDQYVH